MLLSFLLKDNFEEEIQFEEEDDGDDDADPDEYEMFDGARSNIDQQGVQLIEGLSA